MPILIQGIRTSGLALMRGVLAEVGVGADQHTEPGDVVSVGLDGPTGQLGALLVADTSERVIPSPVVRRAYSHTGVGFCICEGELAGRT